MKSWMIISMGSVFTIVCLAVAIWEPNIHTAELGDSTIRYKLAREGAPAVILEASFGGLEQFDLVFDGLAAHTRTFAYDRPGYGKSSATSRSRNVHQIQEDLRALLDIAEVEPPYVLVGSFETAAFALHFAKRYPEQTAGVVLVDGFHPELLERFTGLGLDVGPTKREYRTLPDHMRKELDAYATWSPPPNLGDIPLVVLTSNAGLDSEIGPMWRKTQLELVELSSNSRHVEVSDVGHSILDDRPELVIENILQLVDEVRRSGGDQMWITHSKMDGATRKSPQRSVSE